MNSYKLFEVSENEIFQEKSSNIKKFDDQVNESKQNAPKFYETNKESIDMVVSLLRELVKDLSFLNIKFSFIFDGSITLEIDIVEDQFMIWSIGLDEYTENYNYYLETSFALYSLDSEKQLDGKSGDLRKLLEYVKPKYTLNVEYQINKH